MRQRLIEAAARALASADGYDADEILVLGPLAGKPLWQCYAIPSTTAAVDAVLEGLAEVTPEMVEAASWADNEDILPTDEWYVAVFRAMLSAATAPNNRSADNG